MMMTSVAAASVVSAMTHAGLRSLAAWQGQEVVQVGSGRLVTIFIGLAALALLSQAIVVVAVGVGLLKAQKALMSHVTEIKAKVMPVVDKAQGIVAQVSDITADLKPKIKSISDDLTPKIKEVSSKVETISGHAAEISGIVKDKVAEFGPTVDAAKATIHTANQTVLDATQKTHEQLLRVNEMISHSLDATEKAGKSLRHTVTQPGREIAGIVSGVKAAVSTFFSSNGGKREPYRAPYRENPAAPSSATPYSSAAERARKEDLGL